MSSERQALVAIVDDDADVRIALMRLLSSAGFATETFASGVEFVHAITTHVPACVVLDLHMPGLSGFEVQQELIEHHPEVPVVILTGHDTAEAKRRALSLGAKAYLAKPVDDEALLLAITQTLHH